MPIDRFVIMNEQKAPRHLYVYRRWFYALPCITIPAALLLIWFGIGALTRPLAAKNNYWFVALNFFVIATALACCRTRSPISCRTNAGRPLKTWLEITGTGTGGAPEGASVA